MENTQHHSRRRFLGTVGKTAAAAVGVTLLSAQSAHASEPRNTAGAGPRGKVAPLAVTYRCCVSTCRSCGAGQVAYYCTPNSGACSPFCSTCTTSKGTCYSYASGC